MINIYHDLSQRAWRQIFPQGWAAALAVAGGAAIVGPAQLIAQIEGDRGIAPVVATDDIEIGGVVVDAQGKNAVDARNNGWRDAYKKAWDMAHGPALDVGTIESLVAGVIVENEQVGPHRYRAKLTVAFDRARATQFGAGNGGVAMRSAPMLVVPVLYSGGVGQVYEVKGAWQKVWAEFHTGVSAMDYVRASGAGGDSLLITAGQQGRRSRVWWRAVLDQFGASDVLMPAARLERQWPGGPVKATFTARYGSDNQVLGSFTMTAPDDGAVPAMLEAALKRIDTLYTDALQRGMLRPDPTLSIDHPTIDPGLAHLIDAGRAAEAAQAAAAAAAQEVIVEDAEPVAPKIEAKPVVATPAKAATALTIQFASPDARAVDAALAAVRAVPGVEGAGTTSIAIGGTSVMRASYGGAVEALAAALRARGWQVTTAGTTLRIKR